MTDPRPNIPEPATRAPASSSTSRGATDEPQTVWLSGGSRGLGGAIVQDLLDAGHRVATFSRRPTELTGRLRRDFPRAFWYRSVDAAAPEQLVEFAMEAHEQLGDVDALINNAAIAVDGVLALARDEDLQRMLDINLQGALILAREASRLMLPKRQGQIINIASIIALRGYSGLVGYAATKAGLVGMTRSLARELGPRNIRVNAICPGYLETDMSQSLEDRQRQQIIRRTPLGRLGRPEDIVPWVRFLLSDQAKFATGQVFTIDGGASV